MVYRLFIFMLLLSLAGTGNALGYQSIKDDTEKDRAKRAADNSPVSAKEEPATRLEKFMARKNVLIIKEAYSVGTVPGQQGYEVKVEAVVLAAAGEVSKVYGLSLIRFAGRTGIADRANAREAIVFVDFDEIASLQSALEYLAKVANDTSADGSAASRPPASNEARTDENSITNSSTEFSLLTRGGLKTGMLQLGRQQTGFIQLDTASQDAPVFFGIGALSRFRNLVSQARTKLVALGAR
jgi:hypothetical protein